MSISKLGENQRLMKEGVIAFPESGEPYIVASRCKKCGALHFPVTTLCTDCFSEELETVPMSQEGTIYTFTTVYIGVKGFKTPYILGWIDLDDSRLAAQIDWDPERSNELVIGQKVRLNVCVVRTEADGTEVVGYKFTPIV